MICRLLIKGFCLLFILSGCYSFKGIAIPPTISTFYVDQFQNSVGNAPPDIGQRLTDDLKDRVLRNSRLNFNEEVPDIEFSGAISSYAVRSVAPERRDDGDGATEFGSSLNRLSITVQVDYINNQDDEDTWTQSFTFFEDFDNETSLSDVQDELIDNILSQITTDIFNRSFTNW